MESRAQKRTADDYQKNEKKNPLLYILDVIIKLRFVLAVIALFLIIFFRLNGSSITNWNGQLHDQDHGKKNTVLLGKSRIIRSDEWMVQTPFYGSQTEKGFPVHNDSFSPNGQNMIIAYNAPVKDLTIIGKPFNWGFLFLNRDQGFSWYWGFKLISMILLAFELIMILTKKNKYLAFVGAIAISFSSGVQWWFMQHLGDLVFYSLGLMVFFYQYFKHQDSVLLKLLNAFSCAILGIGFILVLYPAHQVTFGYLLLFFWLATLIHFKGRSRMNQSDILIIGSAVVLVIVCLGHFYLISKDDLATTLGTLYPGKRVSTGGHFEFEQLFYYFTNWKLPFKDSDSLLNMNELSSFYNIFPLVLVLSPFLLGKQSNKHKWLKENAIGVSLMLFCLMMLAWLIIGLPVPLAKISLLSYVPNYRAVQVFSYAAMLLSFWFIGLVWRSRNLIPIVIKITVPALLSIFYYIIIRNTELVKYLSNTEIFLSVAGLLLLMLLALFRQKLLFSLGLLVLIGYTGFTVNPINQGTSALYGKALATEIRKIEKKDPNQLWVSEDSLYNFTPALGVKSFNTVMFTPDIKTWKEIFPDGKEEEIYNRYAHVKAKVTGEPTSLKLVTADSFVASLNPKTLEKLGVKYIISRRDLSVYNIDNISFTIVSDRSPDNYSIFQVHYNYYVDPKSIPPIDNSQTYTQEGFDSNQNSIPNYDGYNQPTY
ncbi:DUF7657 domain-containing protein [Enterococcus devriesei]|uniref:DUF7657 domain-containing protein n=1 Tax=Enterococcus devriesei TaxID=319970 RepID=UPI0028A983AC|nr:hypothetical protein [Enterococcus devriesei]